MALNEVFRDADHLSLPVPAGIKSGDPVRIGGLNGVAQTDRNDGNAPDPANLKPVNTNPVGNASVWLKGAHEFEVDFAVATVGLPIYIDGSNKLTGTASGNSLYGHALTTKAAAAGPLVVRITN